MNGYKFFSAISPKKSGVSDSYRTATTAVPLLPSRPGGVRQELVV